MDEETERAYKVRLREIINDILEKDRQLKLDERKINEVFVHMKKYENIVRGYMRTKDTQLAEHDFLDHHKLAAIFCCSVLKARPISCLGGTQLEQSANGACAYLFGLLVIQNFWDYKNKETVTPEEKAIYGQPIQVPIPNDSETTYQDWFVKLLIKESFKHFDYESPSFGNKLIFTLSHIYFLIDNFSYQYYRAGADSW